MIEGSRSGSVSLTKWIRIREAQKHTDPTDLRIRNTAKYGIERYAFSGYGLFPTGTVRYGTSLGAWDTALNGMHSVVTGCSQQVRYGTCTSLGAWGGRGACICRRGAPRCPQSRRRWRQAPPAQPAAVFSSSRRPASGRGGGPLQHHMRLSIDFRNFMIIKSRIKLPKYE